MNPEWPWVLWALTPLAVAALSVIAVAAGYWHRARVKKAFPGELFERVLPRAVRVRRVVRDALAVLGVLGALIALAGPRFDKQIRTVKAKGVDLVVAVDLSRSMDATDVSPTRLERARREVQDLTAILEGDRVGVVLFAGGAAARLPLTQDVKAVNWVMSGLETSLFQAQGSAFGPAIRAAMGLLDGDEAAGKAVLLLTDGEVHDPEDAVAAAEEAAAAGVTIYAMVIGDRSSPVPGEDGRPMTYQGAPVMSAPDMGVVGDLARRTGGAVVQSVASDADIRQLYHGELRANLRAVERTSRQAETWRAAFQWPLGLGLFALWASAVLGDGRGRRWGQAVALGFALVVLAPMPASANDLAEGDAAYRAERYDDARRIFERLASEAPDDVDLLRRLGAAQYRAGDVEAAARSYDRATRLPGGSADDAFAAGNAHWLAGRLERALQAYEDAMRREPGHARASQNKQALEQELAQRLAQRPPPPPEQGSGGDDESEGGASDQPQDDAQDSEGQQGGQQGGQPTEGSSGGDPSEPKPGDDQDRDKPDQGEGDASAEQDPQPGQDGQNGQGSPSDAAADPTAPSDLDGNPSDPTDGEADPAEDGPPQDGPASGGGEVGDGEERSGMSAAEASKILDAVEEGNQRVRYLGRGTDKPW